MTKVLLLALSLPLLACTVGDGGTGATGTGDDDGSGGGGSNTGSDPGSGTPGGISGSITADTTWSGTMNLLGTVTIEAGVTVTVSPGTTIQSGTADAQEIAISGTLLENGAKGTPVTVTSVAIRIAAGGTLTATYGIHSGGGIETEAAGATATITDTYLSHAGGDFLVMDGGSVTMDYSQIGVGAPTDAAPGSDNTHCDMHFNQATGAIMKINHSNVTSSAYGIMLYASGADVSNNNWYSNTNDFEPGVTGVSGGIADGGWFKTGMPVGVQGVTFNNLSTTPLVGIGPR